MDFPPYMAYYKQMDNYALLIRNGECCGIPVNKQTLDKVDISVRWIDDLCKAGRIYGAMEIVHSEKFRRLQKSLLM